MGSASLKLAIAECCVKLLTKWYCVLCSVHPVDNLRYNVLFRSWQWWEKQLCDLLWYLSNRFSYKFKLISFRHWLNCLSHACTHCKCLSLVTFWCCLHEEHSQPLALCWACSGWWGTAAQAFIFPADAFKIHCLLSVFFFLVFFFNFPSTSSFFHLPDFLIFLYSKKPVTSFHLCYVSVQSGGTYLVTSL